MLDEQALGSVYNGQTPNFAAQMSQAAVIHAQGCRLLTAGHVWLFDTLSAHQSKPLSLYYVV